MSYTMVDLFSGAGGMSLGFERLGFRPVLAVEADPSAAESYRRAFGDVVRVIVIERVRDFPPATLVIGGPPCQGFSPLGRSGAQERRIAMNDLWREYVRAVRAVRPQVFVLENVPQLLTSPHYEEIVARFARDNRLRSYTLHPLVLNAADFGVPQRRRRAFVIGSRIGDPTPPIPTHGPDAPNAYVTVRDAIGDLPSVPDESIDPLHFGRNPTSKSIERYKAVPEGGNRFDLARVRPELLPPCWANKLTGTTDVFGRLSWGAPSSTIRTEFFKPEKGRYIHPEAHRPLTHREAARLQTFPDDFPFVGTRLEIARQIGNAVPPLLAEAVARSVATLLTNAADESGDLSA